MKFFYISLKTRRIKNTIRCLEVNGKRCDDTKFLNEFVTDFYCDLFNKEGSVDAWWKNEWALPSLSENDIAQLVKWVTPTEVEEVVMKLKTDRAPGPDGFNRTFFKYNWTIIKEDVTKAVLSFFYTGKLVKEANRTLIVLIPKGEDTKEIKDYRPISLCNVVYKIISKIMANRLRMVLPSLISKNQFAFVPRRHTLDVILLSNDLLSTVYGEGNWMCIKVDITKAYDSIRWSYLLLILRWMGFPPCWVQVCLESDSFQILFNGEPGKPFHASNGVCQGDPLAPYLFIIVMERLSTMLK